jgi:methylenetetrahydrofolate reductase (NADPH)
VKTFKQALREDRLAITADLTLKGNSGADDVARQCELLGEYVDGLQVTDNPYAWVQMSALAAASLVKQQGVDPIPVLTCRDRNRIALQSDLLGLRAIGVGSVLLTRGHRIPPGHPVIANTVFDTKGKELVAMAARIGDTDPPTPGKEFLIGVGARAFRPQEGWDPGWLNKRSAAGAGFLQTQLCLNLDLLREYMAALVDARLTWKYSVVVTVAALPSVETARWLKQTMSDVRIPAEIIDRMDQSADPVREGISICAEQINEISGIPGISGVNVMTLGEPGSIRQAIADSGLRS